MAGTADNAVHAGEAILRTCENSLTTGLYLDGGYAEYMISWPGYGNYSG